MKLDWKKKWSDDRSSYWHSAKVPVLNWEYIVEDCGYGIYEAGVYLSKTDSEMAQISNKDYKTEKAAMDACEKHLTSTAKKFILWTKK